MTKTEPDSVKKDQKWGNSTWENINIARTDMDVYKKMNVFNCSPTLRFYLHWSPEPLMGNIEKPQSLMSRDAKLCQDILNQNVQTISLEVTDDVSQERKVIEGIIEPVDDYSDIKGSNISIDHGDSHNSTKYEFIMRLYLSLILE